MDKKKNLKALITKLICIFEQVQHKSHNLTSCVNPKPLIFPEPTHLDPHVSLMFQNWLPGGYFAQKFIKSEKDGCSWKVLKKLFHKRKKPNLPPRDEFCISKNMALTASEFRLRPCFSFFDFFSFYANSVFYASLLRSRGNSWKNTELNFLQF